jgi:hypothetical protein
MNKPFKSNSSVVSFLQPSLSFSKVARPIIAPVSLSCKFEVAGVFPQDPDFVQALHPAVCSH